MTRPTFDPAELPPVAGTVSTAEADLALAARDWGGLVSLRPRVVVRPRTTADVAAVVGFAAGRSIPVAVRGAGHSAYGQAQTPGGIVLDLTGLDTVHEVTAGGAVVGAGARWRQVLEATLGYGLAPAVLADYLELTVGGTLAVGGLGGASHRHGAQTDLVTELEVVTGTGEVLTCSARENAGLFDAMRAGLGHCGVITGASVALRTAHRRVRRWTLYYDTLPRLLEDQRLAVGEERFDHVQGQLELEADGQWAWRLDVAGYFSPPWEPDADTLLDGLGFDPERTVVEDFGYLDFLGRMAEGEALLREEGSWFHPHPWLNVLLPDEAVQEVVSETVAETGRAELGAAGLVLLYPVPAARLTTPLLRRPDGELVWLFALLRTGSPDDPRHNARLLDLNRTAYERALAAGGFTYPINALPMTGADWREHYGDAWDTVAEAKSRWDPKNVLGGTLRLT
ncbi:FAD-binding protein [Amycolatopsis suaedae]|uniref:FAD-binding protein n=1 Tax=Amycolatopsis suaedae TaxID=2510978 RepID=A0A4V2EL62_9PSEU|nr:FAD-binding protein [Amycolatopsis suaedae]RZQ60455.1 FAD-binding protein [Amycolatopsis suaedae]